MLSGRVAALAALLAAAAHRVVSRRPEWELGFAQATPDFVCTVLAAQPTCCCRDATATVWLRILKVLSPTNLQSPQFVWRCREVKPIATHTMIRNSCGKPRRAGLRGSTTPPAGKHASRCVLKPGLINTQFFCAK